MPHRHADIATSPPDQLRIAEWPYSKIVLYRMLAEFESQRLDEWNYHDRWARRFRVAHYLLAIPAAGFASIGGAGAIADSHPVAFGALAILGGLFAAVTGAVGADRRSDLHKLQLAREDRFAHEARVLRELDLSTLSYEVARQQFKALAQEYGSQLPEIISTDMQSDSDTL